MPLIEIQSKNNEKINLFYEDYGQGEAIVLVHGWPLTHRVWEKQIDALVQSGHRVIAYDRRGFGQSDKPYSGYDYDTLAADLNGLIEALGLNRVSLAGFSMGGGEVARYIGNYGTAKLSSIMLISAVTPYMQKADDNPNGLEQSVFDGMKNNVKEDRLKFIEDWAKSFTNYDDNKDTISKSQLKYLWLQSTYALPNAMIECIDAFGATDFRNDLKKCNVPCLIVHGDADQICPIEVCGDAAKDYIPDAQYEVIKEAPHGLNMTHSENLNDLMVTFIEAFVQNNSNIKRITV